MKLKNQRSADGYFAGLDEQLTENNLSLIDFDELRRRLSQLASETETSEQVAEEYALLREDLQQRLAGMVKAIAAVDRQRDGYGTALAVIEELAALSASELLRQYRRVSARFRDCFPASFAGVRMTPSKSISKSQVSELK